MVYKKTSFLFLCILLILISISYFKEFLYGFTPFLPKYFLEIIIFILFILTYLMFIIKIKEGEKTKEEIITTITHKFRTPLSGIKWATDSLKKETTFTEKDELLKQITIANDKLIAIVNLLVGLNKINKEQDSMYIAVSLKEMIQNSVEKYSDLIKEKQINFEIAPSNKIPMIIIDKTIFQFVIDTIFDNAIKYNKNGGNVKVSFYLKNKYIILAVSGDGIGITFFERKNIFKIFFRGERAKKMDTEGLGLGLYATKKIVSDHGGKIWFKSNGKDNGATFFVKILKAS